MADEEVGDVEMQEKKQPKAKRRKPTPAAEKSPSDAPKAGAPAKKAAKATEPADTTPRQSVDSVRYSTDDAERNAALKLFREFDTDHSGNIDAKELDNLCRRVGRPLNKKELQDAIDVLDKDKNGTVDFEEFYAWFSNRLTGTATPRHMMLADVRRKMRHYTPSNLIMDTLGPAIGVVVPTDFSFDRMVQESQHVWSKFTAGTGWESSKKKRVRAIFDKYDADHSGHIDLEEFGRYCEELGDKFTPHQLEVALHEIDEDGNGTIEFEEFYKWWCSDPDHEEDADFANRLRNMVFGYRDMKPMDEAKKYTETINQKPGASGDPGLIAENRRLKQQLADMQAQLDKLQGTQDPSPSAAPSAKGGVSFKKDVPPPRKADPSPPPAEADDASSEDDDDADSKPQEAQPRKKKGKRKSRKPQKLEDSDDYETSEDQTGKVSRGKK